MKIFVALALVLAVSTVSASAQMLEEAEAAYSRGDYATALRGFRALAEQGNAAAQLGLGIMYDEGEGVAEDDAEAARWYRRAAEQGDADAQYNLGIMYDEGEGVAEDDAEAARWYRRAAEQGDADAQSSLGVLYYQGKGVPRNYLQAHVWANLAASRLTGEERETAVKLRDEIAALLSKSELGRAQRIADEWRPKPENE